MKKLLSILFVALLAVSLVACSKKIKVTFDTQGGSTVDTVETEKNQIVFEPTDPKNGTQSFLGWFTTKDGKAGTEFDFTQPVTKSVKLFAVWTDQKIVRFRTKTSQVVETAMLGTGGEVAKPADPTRAGFVFGGWFNGKAGLTWLETEAVKFPLTTNETLTLHAYWEPVNSKTANYTNGETYFSTITSDSSLILNPLTYEFNHEDDYMGMMSTPLYSTEVDWDLAVKQGVADRPGDFSKIVAKEFSVEALDYKYIKLGATKYPMDNDGNEFLDANGNYDRVAATTNTKTEWTFTLNPDVVFEDGTKVTARTYEYTLKNALSSAQNNFRANTFYKTETNPNGRPIKNAYEYYKGEVAWEEVGFTVIDDYTFKVTYFEAQSQAAAVGFGGIKLVHPENYEKSLNSSGKSTYGTPESPYMSYGGYVIKTWDENQKLVFNKNYDYVAKGTINYKSRVIEVVDDIHQTMQLFEEGKLSVAGLNKDYYAQYNERPNVYNSWGGSPSNLLINLAKRTDGKAHNPAMFDPEFRQALLYGFNRNYYATNIYAPNTASIFSSPLNIKVYLQDPLMYVESPEHLAVLEKYGIVPATNGFSADKAKALFDKAYAANGGQKIVMEFLSEDDSFSRSMTEYVKSAYEELFGKDKFEIAITFSTGEAYRKHVKEWNFDLVLNSVGFGSNSGVQWQYPAIAFLGDMIGGGALGLSQPYDESKYNAETNPDSLADYYFEEITVELNATFEMLENMGEAKMKADDLKGHLELWEALKADGDKPAGTFKGEMNQLALIMITLDNPYDGTAAEPFAGATQEVWKIVAAFEEVFYAHAPIIPTVTRSSSTIYAPNVVIEWPEYSGAFSWGSDRYRHLNTDTDFR